MIEIAVKKLPLTQIPCLAHDHNTIDIIDRK